MKNLYIAAFSAAFLFASEANSQCSVDITASTNDTVCAGTSTTLTANVLGPATTLQTTFAAGNNHRGNMFDITATNTVTILSFDAHPMGNTTIEIYYRTSPYAGFETSSAGWTLIGSAAVTAQPFGNPTPVPVAVNVTIPAGQTYAFYVSSTNTAVSLNYTDGSVEGSPYVNDANIVFRQGVGMEYPFTNGTGGVFRPRIWNGIIHYTVPGTPSYLWSTAATTSVINEMVNASAAYSVEVNVAGCPVLHDTLQMTVSAPTADAGNNFAVCTGMTTLLLGNASGNAPLQLSWDQGVTDNVPFTPVMTNDYILTVTDAYGCTDADTMNLAVNALPIVSAGNDAVVCAGGMHTLSGSGAVAYTWDNGITDGVPFTVNGTMTYEVIGTDANGCVDNDSVTVTMHTVNIATSVLNETITAADTTASYQWIDCSTMQPVAGETNYWFTATVNGSYAVVITDSVCSDTSACETILSTGLNTMNVTNGISVYPNPNEGSFTLTTTEIAQHIVITDVTGRVISAFAPQNVQVNISLEGHDHGVYFVTVTSADNTVHTVKVVTQ